MQPVPFVVGCMRSGTTLLRGMLGAHPDLAVTPESRFIASLHSRHGDGIVDVDRFVMDLLAGGAMVRWDISETDVRDALPEPPFDYGDAIRNIHAWYAAKQGKARYGNKTPTYVRDIALLHRVLPEARFIHIVRDPRDVVPAITQARFGPKHLGAAALYWDRDVAKGMATGRLLSPSHYTELHYERLVADPEAVLHEVCAFVALDFDEAMLHPEINAAALVAETRFPDEHTALNRPISVGLRDWRVDVAARDVAMIEAVVGVTMTTAGYERRFASLPLAARVRAGRVRFVSPRVARMSRKVKSARRRRRARQRRSAGAS